MPRLYSPPETAQLVGIAEPTLRSWATQHGDLLSEYARRAKRQYTTRDVAVLQAIKDLVAGGVEHGAVTEQIRTIPLPDEASEDDAAQEAPRSRASAPGDPYRDAQSSTGTMQLVAVQLSAAQADQAQRLTGQDARIADQAEQIADLRERVARLEAEAAAQRRDLDAHGRLLEALSQRLDDHAGQIGSVGGKAHGHEGIGRTLSGMKS